MDKISQYILKEFFTFFFYCFISFITISSLFIILIQTSKGEAFEYGWQYFMLKIIAGIPIITDLILPINVLFATVFSFISLSKTSEIVVMKAAGKSLFQIIIPVLIAGCLISCFAYFNQSYLVQWLKVENTIPSIKNSINKITWSAKGNKLFFIAKAGDSTDQINKVIKYTFNSERSITSKQILKNLKLDEKWHVKKQTTIKYSPVKLSFQEQEHIFLDKFNLPSTSEKQLPNPIYLPFLDILQSIIYNQKFGLYTKRFYFAFFRKITTIITIFVMIILAMPFSIVSTREADYGKKITIAIVFGLSFWIIDQIFTALNEANLIATWLAAFGANIIFATLAMILIFFSQSRS